MATALRRSAALGAWVLLFGLLATACSHARAGEPGATGTSGSASFIDLSISSIFMTVENKAGAPLLGVRLAIRPIGAVTEYDKLIPRLEAGETRSLSLGEFSGRDGTPFSLRFVRPKDVTVSATDLVGKNYATTIPWPR